MEISARIMAEGNGGSPLEELRSLIVGPEQSRLEDLEERLEHAAPQAEDVSRVLPAAITLGKAQDDRLQAALAPLMEETLKTSVERDPQPIADAIFPVIGPAIRKAISAAIGGLVQTLNQALEHTFSLQGLRWRLEALRTGTSFGEIVLRRSLVYRVEQLFLVHREGGLLLLHVTAESLGEQSPEMVAGMLSAIQDFARDSFHVGSRDTLETMQVGDLVVIVEDGPYALLAAVVRGHPPVALRTDLQQALETVHAMAAHDLAAFNGDASVFARVKPVVERCLRQEVAAPPKKGRWRFWLLAAVVIAGLALWLIPAGIRARRWDRFVNALRAVPGIVITETGRRDGRFFVAGLRDPAAASPDSFLARAGLSAAGVDQRWEPYYSLDASFVLARARTMFAPQIADIEQQAFYYPVGQDVLPDQQLASIPALARQIRALGRAASAMGLKTMVTILGQTDETGEKDVNIRLGQGRAEQVRSRLEAGGAEVTLVAVGAEPPVIAPGAAAGARAERRKVTFTVEFTQP
jgi:OOP family OmpA-OmpF porin